jgi:uncharacterized protein (DUF427 family)
LTDHERIKKEFIARAMARAGTGRYPILEPGAEDNGRDLQWWLRALDAKAFLISTNGSAAWLFPHYELRLRPLPKRVVVEYEGETLVDSENGFEFRETAHSSQIYLPPSEVRLPFLFRTDTATFCPYKGMAHYYGVRVKRGEIADAFWCYGEPYDKFPGNGNASDVSRLAGMLAPDPRKLNVTLR